MKNVLRVTVDEQEIYRKEDKESVNDNRIKKKKSRAAAIAICFSVLSSISSINF